MKRLQANLQLLIVIGIIVVLNFFSYRYFRRLDLTAEKRYSLADVTEETLEDLQYPLYATVYLEGNFPPNIREFQEALRTTLIEMQQYAGADFNFEYVDPGDNRELMQEFAEQGYAPVPVKVQLSTTETKEQFMWPLVALRYREREQYVDLLKGASMITPQGPNVNFAKAEGDLEYKLTSALMNLSRERQGIIGLLRGHGELVNTEIGELGLELSNRYQLVDFNQATTYAGTGVSPDIQVLLVLQPTEPFSERDKYELDQYLMRGGRIVFIMDQQQVDLNMYRKQSTLTSLYDLNLDDLFLKYGAKLNYDLVQDLNAESTELFLESGGEGTFVQKKWLFFPMVLDFPNHPVTRNVDAVLLRYASSVDTFSMQNVEKTVFLSSSQASRTIQGRQFIDLNQYLQSPPPPALFNRGNRIMGVLMEGLFPSLFVGRDAPTDSLAPEPPTAKFGPRNNPSAPGAVAIISDGEFVQGKMFYDERQYMPYDNKALVMNLIDYLAGDESLTEIRSKEVVIRRLSREKVAKSETWLRVLNLGAPLLLLALFGLSRYALRRRQHARLKQ
jgi:gliding-associated putative ABC transporter substrate-binding component GldG